MEEEIIRRRVKSEPRNPLQYIRSHTEIHRDSQDTEGGLNRSPSPSAAVWPPSLFVRNFAFNRAADVRRESHSRATLASYLGLGVSKTGRSDSVNRRCTTHPSRYAKPPKEEGSEVPKWGERCPTATSSERAEASGKDIIQCAAQTKLIRVCAGGGRGVQGRPQGHRHE